MAVETGDKVTRKYANFRGVDFRGEECSLNRSPDSLNVWKNYKKLASIETRPGLKYLHAAGLRITCMMWGKDKLKNDKLYYITDDGYLYSWCSAHGQEDLYYGEEQIENCYIGKNGILFSFGGKVYAMGEKAYVNVTDGKEVEPYIPTTTIAGKPASDQDTPSGGGKTYEDVNLLTNRRINTFLGDGASRVFYLDAYAKKEGAIVTVDGRTLDGPGSENPEYEWLNSRCIDFHDIPDEPRTVGQDNVSIEFEVDMDLNGNKVDLELKRKKVLQNTLVQEFDNRVFFSGNPDNPNMVRHCSLENPGYVSDLDYYEDGADRTPIRGMVAGNNGLWVFRDYSPSNNNVFYHTPALDEEYGKIYPSSHSSIAIGCEGRACNFNDDIVFFSRRGMEGASTDITTEQFVTHRSSLVDRVMLTNPYYKNMVLTEWEGYLFVFIGSDAYLADSRAVLTNENHIEYEWYRWNWGDTRDVGVVTCATVHDGVLYIATDFGEIYSFKKDPEEEGVWDDIVNRKSNERKTSIDSYWTTPLDRFGAQNKLKTTNKKGCVVEAKGDISVYVKVEDEEFELIGTYENIKDYFSSRIKRKKWKDIQLRFQSKTSFSLETATLEAFIGGYIKR